MALRSWHLAASFLAAPTPTQASTTTQALWSSCQPHAGSCHGTEVLLVKDRIPIPTLSVDAVAQLIDFDGDGTMEAIVGMADGSVRYMKPAEVTAFSWSVTTGNCRVDAEGCLTSPNFPSNYINSDKKGSECEIAVQQGSDPIAVSFETFATEQGYDVLKINGRSYSGFQTGHAVVPQGVITWRPDHEVVDQG